MQHSGSSRSFQDFPAGGPGRTSKILRQALDETVAFTTRFVVFADEAQPVAVALWAAHTHALRHADVTPYLAVTGPAKRVGKTRLLEVVELIAARPLPAASITPAALFRTIDAELPTLLLDEVDAVFGARANGNEDLRALINAGHRRGLFVYRVGGAKMTELQKFSTFCPKLLAGIGRLPDTVADRSIPIRLQRKRAGETVERFRRKAAAEEGESIRAMLAAGAEHAEPLLDFTSPTLPEALNDRAADAWEPLLAIADAAGGDWPGKARRAAVALHTGSTVDDDALAVRLLVDVATVVEDLGKPEKVATAILLDRLHALEEAPWSDLKGRPLTPRTLARLLGDFGLHSKKIRIGDRTCRGWSSRALLDVAHRYMVPPSGTRGTTLAAQGISAKTEVEHGPARSTSRIGENPRGARHVPDVPDRTPQEGAEAVLDDASALVLDAFAGSEVVAEEGGPS